MEKSKIKEVSLGKIIAINKSGKNFWLKIKWNKKNSHNSYYVTEILSSDVLVVRKPNIPIKILRIRKDLLWRKLNEKLKV